MKKRVLFLIAVSFLMIGILKAQQKYFTKSGSIEFYSHATVEDIKATNNSAVAVLDTKNGNIQFSVLMKGFQFKKALMQEHFNENYVESSKYPKSTFKGTITNNSDIKYSVAGNYTAKVKGKLTIHGVTREIETTGTIKVGADRINASSTFNIRLADYNIEIPALVKENISETIQIKINTVLETLK